MCMFRYEFGSKYQAHNLIESGEKSRIRVLPIGMSKTTFPIENYIDETAIRCFYTLLLMNLIAT